MGQYRSRKVKVGQYRSNSWFENYFESLGSNEKKSFDWRPESGANNSISCLKINFELLGKYEKDVVTEVF